MLNKDAWDEALLGSQPNPQANKPRVVLPGPSISKALIPLTGLLLALVVYSGVQLSDRINFSMPDLASISFPNSLPSVPLDNLAASVDLAVQGYSQLNEAAVSLADQTTGGIKQEFSLVTNLAAAAMVVPKSAGFMAASGLASIGDWSDSIGGALGWWLSNARDFLIAYGQEIGNRWRSFISGKSGPSTRAAEPLPVTLDAETRNDIKDIKSGVTEILQRLGSGSAGLPTQGMVVVPKSGNTTSSDLKTKVGSMFSDQVNVNFDETGQAGVITPVFRQGPGSDYLFVLTPISP